MPEWLNPSHSAGQTGRSRPDSHQDAMPDGKAKTIMYYVYILKMNNDQLYTGFTADLKRRVKDHEYGKVKSTKLRRPLLLIHYEAYVLESDARRREKFLKTSVGKQLLKKQIRDYLHSLNKL